MAGLNWHCTGSCYCHDNCLHKDEELKAISILTKERVKAQGSTKCWKCVVLLLTASPIQSDASNVPRVSQPTDRSATEWPPDDISNLRKRDTTATTERKGRGQIATD